MAERRRHSIALGFICCAALLLIALTVAKSYLYGPRIFRRFVLRPIPASVQEIRADHCEISHFIERLYGSRERAYVLRFSISQEDVLRIVATRGFKRWEPIQYSDGVLTFKDTDGYEMGIELYTDGRSEPDWFDLARWEEWQTYYMGEDGIDLSWLDASLLLYNEQMASAYFVKYRVTGL